MCFCALFDLVLCFVCTMLPVSLDCPFLIIPSVSSNVYLVILSSSRVFEFTIICSRLQTKIAKFYIKLYCIWEKRAFIFSVVLLFLFESRC